MTLSIIIPCKNEEDLIYKNLHIINNKIKKSIKKYQIIVVNDFSEDNTLKIARKFVNTGIRKGLIIGKGHNPINHFVKI